jgi:ParB family chromosome partitioning protein
MSSLYSFSFMGNNSGKALGAIGRDDLLYFDPGQLLIVEDPKHPLFDERCKLPIDEAMVLDIMSVGVLEPVIVRGAAGPDGARVIEVVDGRQRVRNAREANARLRKRGKELVRVPAIRKRGEDADLMAIMISTNEHRRDDDLMVKAKKAQRFLGLGRSEEEAAVIFGVSKQTIKNWLAALECAPAVRAALEREQVTLTQTLGLSKLSREEQIAKLGELLKGAKVQPGRRGRAKAARAAGVVLPKLPSRKTLAKVREEVGCYAGPRWDGFAEALDWILGVKPLPEELAKANERKPAAAK